MTTALLAAGGVITLAAVVAGVFTRRPGSVLDRDRARRAWQEVHGLDRPLQETSRLVGRYITAVHAAGRPLARWGWAPNAVTAAALGPAVVAAALIGKGSTASVAGGILVLAVGMLDGVDGAVAVLSDRVTGFGHVLDSVTDRVVDLVFLAGPVLANRSRPEAAWTAGTAVGAGAALMLLEYLRARMQVRDPQVGRITPAERPTRVVLLGLGGVGSGCLDLAAVETAWFWPVGLAGLAVLCLLSASLLLADSRRIS